MNLNKFRLAALVLFAAMITTNVNAQSIKYPKMHFGIRLGGTFNTATVNGEKITGVTGANSPTGGFALDFRIASIPLYMETGIYCVNRTLCIKDGYDKEDITGQVPLLLSYHYYISDKVAVQPFAGGYASYGHNFVPGARFGVGINYGRLYANVGYDIDLAERDVDHGKYKSPGIFTTIGFNFGGSR